MKMLLHFKSPKAEQTIAMEVATEFGLLPHLSKVKYLKKEYPSIESNPASGGTFKLVAYSEPVEIFVRVEI